MNIATQNPVSAREFLGFYYRNKGKLQTAFWVPFVLAVLVSFVPSPRYNASAVLAVRMGSEYVYQPEVGSAQNSTQQIVPYNQDQIFKSEVAIINSDDLHAKVIQEIGMDQLYPSLDKPGLFSKLSGTPDADAMASAENLKLLKAVTLFDRKLDVNLEKESSVITVSFENKDPDVAVKVLEVLLASYLEKRKGLFMQPRAEMVKSQVEEARLRAVAAQKAVETFKSKHNIHSLTDERQSLITQRADLVKQRANIKSPALDSQIAYFDAQMNRYDKAEQEFNALTNDATMAQDEYSLASHRLGEAAAYEDLEHQRAGSVSVIQTPTAPAEPKKLQPVIIMLGFIFSLLCALGMAIVTNFLDSGFSTPEKLERVLKLPVLTTLPRR